MALRCCLALGLAPSIAWREWRRGSLSGSGAAAAFAVGVAHLACSWTAGATLLCFFLSSSRLTRLGQQQKAAADAHVKLGGQRTAWQVLANSGCGAAISLLLARPGSSPRRRLSVWAAFLGHYACCCSDTWASELGMLSRRPPRLLTAPWRAVPAGVNGGVTLVGTCAGAAGAACMALSFWLVGWLSGELEPPLTQLIGACMQRHSMVPAGTPAPLQQLLFWLGVGVVCGIAGSLVDSLLGACLQFSGVDPASGKVVGRPGPGVRHVSGRLLLSNDAVNATSALLSSLAAAGLALSLVGHAADAR